MSFEVYGASSTNSNSKSIDWEAYNAEKVKQAGLEKTKTLVGTISNIVDLGRQELPDAEYDVEKEDVGLTVDELNEKYAEKINDVSDPLVGFDMRFDGQKKQTEIKKIVKQKSRQCVAFSIDFLSKPLDLGGFFGKDAGEDVKPLRIWYGGKFYTQAYGNIVQNLNPIKVTKNSLGEYVCTNTSFLRKIAIATGVIEDGEEFNPKNLDKLLGKSALFSAQVSLKEGKDKNKGRFFLTEKVKLVGSLMDGQEPPEAEKAFLIQFNKENEEQAISELPLHVKNTIKRAENYEVSQIKKQLEDLTQTSVSDEKENSQDGEDNEVLDEDLPF